MSGHKNWQNRIIGEGEESPDQLLANPMNFRIHPKFQQDALSGVLNEIGWIQRVIVNQTTGHVIDGHLRAQLAISRGETSIPVLYVSLTEQEEKLALATIDPISAMAATDKAQLDALLQQVTSGDAAVMQMLSELAADNGLYFGEEPEIPDDPGAQVDKAEELQAKWNVKRGDLWVIPSKTGKGEHRLLCADSTNTDDVARVMDGQKADAVINDPPYGMRLDADYSGMKSNLKFSSEKSAFGGRKYDNVTGDHDDYDASVVRSLFVDVKEQFWFGADYYSSTLGDTMHSGTWLVWDKRLTEDADKMFGSCFELVWSAQPHKRDILRVKWAGVFGVEQEPERQRFHPNHKPVELYREIQERYVPKGGIVVDCYMGAGSNLVACEQTQRQGRGIEIEAKYVSATLERLSQMGLEPRLVES